MVILTIRKKLTEDYHEIMARYSYNEKVVKGKCRILISPFSKNMSRNFFGWEHGDVIHKYEAFVISPFLSVLRF